MLGRPTVPLVVRSEALRIALEMIDADGAAAFSVRKLARALGVTSPSLYHHFGTRAEIVDEAARLALADVWAAQPGEGDWRDWLWTGALRLRSALVRHPGLVPVITGRQRGAVMAHALESWAARLIREGVPTPGVLPIVETVVQLAVGSALQATLSTSDEPGAGAQPYASHPELTQALTERGLTGRECFEIILRNAIHGLGAAVDIHPQQWPTPQDDDEPGPTRAPDHRRISEEPRETATAAADAPATGTLCQDPGPPMPSQDHTRETIIRAEREAFNARGYQGTGLSDIAARAGVPQRSVRQSFASKQHLFRIVFESTRAAVIETGVKSAAGSAHVGDQIAAFLRAAVQADSLDPSHARFIAGSAVDASRAPELRPTGRDQVDQVREFLHAALHDAQRANQISPSADVTAVTEMLLAALWGM